MILRSETEADGARIRDLVRAAFGRPDEAALVDALRDEGDAAVSLVAEEDGAVIGHILLSPMRVPKGALGLAPLSVAAGRRRTGVGAALVRRALAAADADGWTAVFVLGDPAYFRRFGFDPAPAKRFRSVYSGPYLQALELKPGALAAPGQLVYARAFDDLE